MTRMWVWRAIPLLTVFLLGAVMSTVLWAADEDLINTLRDKIDDRSTQIEELEQEIKQYEVQLDTVQKEKNTLERAVQTLDISYDKLTTDVQVTQNRISATTFQIEKLALEIKNKEQDIVRNNDTLAESIRRLDAAESRTFIETLLTYESLSDLWKEVESLQQFQEEMRHSLNNLKQLKTDLVEQRDEREARHRELVNYEYQVTNQQTAVAANRSEKNQLLAVTKNEESAYEALLAEKREARRQFERELFELEAQLEIAIDPNSIPAPRHGVISWPIENPRITQFFGDTEFAKSGAYNGKGHNGVDFGTPSGTPILSTLSGVVVESGNTDDVPGCYSYGKWILIQHNNGLSSLYAHLSVINVSAGDQVLTGQTIGYSGNTGYSTGPHLHFSVFATQGIRIVKLGDIKKITNCGPARVPVASLNAYMNPIEYLPALTQ